MFVRKKVTSSGTVQHYLVENRREGGKVRQKVLYYLGAWATVEEALEYFARMEQHYRDSAAYYRDLSNPGGFAGDHRGSP
jgi:hypothetical protein